MDPVSGNIRLVIEPWALQREVDREVIQSWGQAPEIGAASFFRVESGYLLRFAGIADFILSEDGRTVECRPALAGDLGWKSVYEQQVVPLARAQQDYPVFHGGAFARNGRAIALLGASGQGKSTLTAACAARGYTFLTDDCLILRSDEDPIVEPGPGHIRVWEDSYQVLSGSPAPKPDPGQTQKPRIEVGRSPECAEPARLVCMVAIDGQVGSDGQADRITLARLSPGDAAMIWRANAFVVDQRSGVTQQRSLARAATLARTMPGFRLTFPRNFARLSEVAEIVCECLDTVIDA